MKNKKIFSSARILPTNVDFHCRVTLCHLSYVATVAMIPQFEGARKGS